MVTSQNGRKVRSVSNSTYTMLVYLMKNHVHSFSNQQCPMNNASNAMWTWINTQLSLAKCLTSFSSLFWYYSPKPTFSSVQSLPLLRLWVIHSSPINEQNVEKAVKKRSILFIKQDIVTLWSTLAIRQKIKSMLIQNHHTKWSVSSSCCYVSGLLHFVMYPLGMCFTLRTLA